MSYKHHSQIDTDEHAVISDVAGKKVFIIDSLGNVVDFTGDSDYKIFIEIADGTTTYIGKAEAGTATSASTWQIKRIDSTSGANFEFASGTVDFDKVWDDRASYSYS